LDKLSSCQYSGIVDGESICRRRPALDAQGKPIPGYETLTWDARVTDRLRQFVKNHPSQMPLF